MSRVGVYTESDRTPFYEGATGGKRRIYGRAPNPEIILKSVRLDPDRKNTGC